MITASHNPAQDNGLKLIDTDGGMFSPDLEASIIEFVQLKDDQIEHFILNHLKSTYGTFTLFILKLDLHVLLSLKWHSFTDPSVIPQVYIGWDSRTSSVGLSQEVAKGVTAVGGKYVDFGLVTTPQLHFLVHIQVC